MIITSLCCRIMTFHHVIGSNKCRSIQDWSKLDWRKMGLFHSLLPQLMAPLFQPFILLPHSHPIHVLADPVNCSTVFLCNYCGASKKAQRSRQTNNKQIGSRSQPRKYTTVQYAPTHTSCSPVAKEWRIPNFRFHGK